MPTKRVLFICTGNSARSQMAEGLLKSQGEDQYDVHSAGTLPSFVRPQAIQVMKEIGIDISGQYSKSLEEFINQAFDCVITVCDNAKEICPVFHGAKKMLHWSIEDPVGIWGPEEVQLEAFRKARDDIRERIEKVFTIRQMPHAAPDSSK